MIREIEISVKIGCPVFCSYCPQDKLLKVNKKTTLTCDNLKQIIQNTSQDNPVNVYFAGFTEPFSVKHWADLFNICENHPNVNQFIVFTTGWKLNKDAIIQISKFKKLARFNFHTPYNDTTMPNFSLDLSLLPTIKQYIPKANFIGVGFERSSFESLIKKLKEHQLTFSFQPIISRSGNVTEVNGTTLPLNKIKRPVTCIKISEHKKPVVLPDGKTLVCCNDYGCELPIGNLLNQTWDELDFDKVIKIQNDPKNHADLPCFRDCHFAKPLKTQIPL